MAMAAGATTAPRRRFPDSALVDWLTTSDHKKIGILYLLTSLFFFLIGGIEAFILRLQLTRANLHLISPELYNEIFTMHGTTMIFLVVMPLLAGFANYFVPLMIGARDMAFPKLNALGYWLFLFGGLFFNLSWLFHSAPDAGWYNYANQTELAFSPGLNEDFWALGINIVGISSLASAVNLVVTILKLRRPGMTINRMPIFCWTVLVQAALILGAIPSLTVSSFEIYLDRHIGTSFFQAGAGGDPLLWQHLFWFFGHPEVYILILPAFGMISEVLPVFSRKPLFGYTFVAWSTVAIGFLSFGVWAHHMFAAGLTGVMVAVVPVDWQVTATYFVVAHFHYVLFGGTAFAVFAAAYYWFPKITGRLLDERLGRWHFWLTFVGFNLTFFPMHIVGILGMSRRISTYPAGLGWSGFNTLETIGTVILAVSVLAFVANILRSLRAGVLAGDNPWEAFTLEWATASPPPVYNFRTIPTVRSRRPVWDIDHPDDPDWQRGH
jgi:heme/copper-type cytochrome/quinol oxidase subunit 1